MEDEETDTADEKSDAIASSVKNTHAPKVTTPPVPAAISQLIGTAAEPELVAVAKLIGSREHRNLVFHTPVGDVTCPILWSSSDPSKTQHIDPHLLLVMARSGVSAFAPKPGAELEISFTGGRQASKLRVVCLAPPMQLYTGAGVDLLCFLPQNVDVEKTGKLQEAAPSVVSGSRSNDFDEQTGEPIVTGEKSASMKQSLGPERAPDFDTIREG